MINLQSTRKPSFTLIELIVVITIIAVLVAFGSVAYGGAQKNSRDARRIEDLNAIQKAMELAFDQGGGESYPTTVSALLGTGTLSIWPSDPKTNSGYALTSTSPPSPPGYCVCTLLEARKNGNSTAYNCSSFTSDPSLGTYYCVKNQQ